jgi:hypothetical protein
MAASYPASREVPNAWSGPVRGKDVPMIIGSSDALSPPPAAQPASTRLLLATRAAIANILFFTSDNSFVFMLCVVKPYEAPK